VPFIEENIFDDLPVTYDFYGKDVGYVTAHNWAIRNSVKSKYHLL